MSRRYPCEPCDFWIRVYIGAPDECWPFIAARASGKHRGITYQGKWIGAHVLAYVLTNGPVTEGLIVRHKCDYPPCCNPSHLLVGTHKDNAMDREQRGRGQRRKVLS